MANKKTDKHTDEVSVVGVAPVEKDFFVPEKPMFDKRVTVISLDADPFHETGKEFQMAEATAKTQQKKGLVKIKLEDEK